MEAGRVQWLTFRRRWAVAGLAVGLVAAGALLVGTREAQIGPNEAIAALRASWGDATGVHFEGTIATGEATGAGSEPASDRSVRVEGRLLMPDRGHWVLEGDSSALEVVVVPGGGYSRRARERAQLPGVPWEWVDVPVGPVSTTGVIAVGAGEPFGFSGFEPAGLGGMVGALGPPVEIADGVYRATLPVGAALDHPHITGELSGSGVAELTLEDGGRRMDRMRWHLEVVPEESAGDEDDEREFATPQRVEVDLRFTQWNDNTPLMEPGAPNRA